jgi:hypothetical protein
LIATSLILTSYFHASQVKPFGAKIFGPNNKIPSDILPRLYSKCDTDMPCVLFTAPIKPYHTLL